MFNYERVEIFIRAGLYNEKFRIDRDYVTITGESREETIIQYSQPRESWNKQKDSIGPAVINIFADDIILNNLTVENTQPDTDTHAFAVYGTGTRIILTNCNILSSGGDALALWNYKTGMYYQSNCCFKGAVDFVCPRGWCYIRDSKFYEVRNTASIWHAGSFDPDQKFVIENSFFDGAKDFLLGRHHYEAQFYLLNCRFSGSMADKPIYRVTYPDSALNRPFNWGERDYFYNCSRDGGNFGWFKNNITKNEAEQITCKWTFGGRWDPESGNGPVITRYEIHNKNLLVFFNETISVINKPVLKSNSGKIFRYNSGAGSNTIRFTADQIFSENDLKGLKIADDGEIIGNSSSVKKRTAVFNISK